MNKLTGHEIRETWLRFFKSKGHKVEKGASLIPYNDPTLLWINSGVAALKKYFDGSEVPPSRRITNVQKSIRTNDIENVGYTARHHTFFEMLGNFSIGDYFRKEVIAWAHEILTSNEYFGMPDEKLYFTYHPNDLEAKKYWMEQGVSEDHLIPLEGNYWQIGEGPCGPNTEVFFDRGEKYDPNKTGIKMLKEDMENDRYVEIWGIVFSQFNAVEGVKREDYKELPSKNIDTGAGLERIACVLQETETNFETDLFMPIIRQIEKIAKVPYVKENYICYRVIADHIRAISFATLDGENFSNEGRGYVLRRLLRRAMRYGKKIGIEKPFMHSLVNTVVGIYKDFYPEFLGNEERISKTIKSEEEKFLLTLESGEEMLRKMIAGKTTLDGKDAFKLYDTYGFPIDLTKDICSESNITVDEEGFKVEMEAQKDRARSSRKELQSMKKQSKDLLEFTEASTFSYDNVDTTSKVIGLFVDGVKVDSIGEEGDVIFANTTFYAESGGQIADTGAIQNSDSFAEVTNVQKAPNKQNIHHIVVKNGIIKIGDEFTLKPNHQRRELIKRNHTSAHLLQSALCKVLGSHITQQGSYVSDEYMRFDFNHNDKISSEQLKEIESIVNSFIHENHAVNIKVLPIEEAKKLGAKAFFNDKYGDEVRVVIVEDGISMEFCGGTHVSNTKDIGIFKIESEESIASGIRRIQARTSFGAEKLVLEKEDILDLIKQNVGSSSIYEINDRINALLKQIDELKKSNVALSAKLASAMSSSIKDEFEQKNGLNVLVKHLKDNKREDLLKVCDTLKSNCSDYAIVLIGNNGSAVPVVACLSKTAKDKGLKAGDIVRSVAQILGGSGGGNPEIAFGQGKDSSKISEAIDFAKGLF